LIWLKKLGDWRNPDFAFSDLPDAGEAKDVYLDDHSYV
jgi:hypothetical protein